MPDSPASPRVRRVLLGALALGVLAPTAAAVLAWAAAPALEQHPLVPAYFYPAEGANPWPELCSSPDAATVIVNPDSGPGRDLVPEYAEVIDDCRAEGQRVIGYVGTDYAERPLAEVQADIDRYEDLYGVEGIFLDEMSSDDTPAVRAYYRQLRAHVEAEDADRLVVGNPGWADETTAWHVEVADVVVAFEDTAAAYRSWAAPSWTLRAPAETIGHLVHTTGPVDVARVQDLSVQRNAGHIYITDDVLGNPWDTLPSYWNVAPALAPVQQHVAPATARPDDSSRITAAGRRG